jgi:uncharacterized protein YkwD
MLANVQEPRGVKRSLLVIAAALLLPASPAAAAGEVPVADPGAVGDVLAPVAGGDTAGAPAAEPAPATADAGTAIGDGAVFGIAPLPIAPPDVTALAASCPGAGSRPSRARADTMRAAVLCLVNHARARNGVRALHGDAHLARAARNHARDMVRRRYFGHQRIGGRSPAGRARAAGWHGSALGEAIAYGCGRLGTAASTVRAWLNSPGHRAILLSRTYGRVGIGLAKRAPVSCRGGATWVLDAGRG